MSGGSGTAAPAPTSVSRGRALACVALLVLIGFALGCSEFVVIGIEAELAAAFQVPLARVGELISFFSVAYAVLTPTLAIVTGRFRRYPLLAVYAALFCLANVVMVFAPTFELLLASRVLLGAVSGGLLALGITYIPELVGAERSSMTISVVYASFAVAMVFITSVGKIVAHALDWHLIMVAALVLAVASSVALLAVLPRTGSTDAPATMREQVELFREPQVACGVFIFLFGVGSVYVLYGYVTPYLEQVLGLDAVAASAVLMAYGVACFFSNLLSGWLDSRFGIKALSVTFPVQALLLFGVWVLGGNALGGVAAILCVGLSMYLVSVPCVSVFMNAALRWHPKALTLASSLEPTSFNMGIAFGTAMGGAVVSGPGLAHVGAVGAAFSLVAWGLAALTYLLERRRVRVAR
ncbi:MFS transporter [Enorma burkinafasonensis]|uniref:MFS transporter n=1 Tax=Enorma burkinafasonensis TaxID=2590867 RepID=UPI001FE3F343|nr:MFS transporter [Enorma burkinafasonensis]